MKANILLVQFHLPQKVLTSFVCKILMEISFLLSDTIYFYDLTMFWAFKVDNPKQVIYQYVTLIHVCAVLFKKILCPTTCVENIAGEA